MGDWLVLTVSNPPPSLMLGAAKKTPLLVLAGVPIRGLYSWASPSTNNAVEWHFHLEWNDASASNLVALLHNPHFGAWQLDVGICTDDGVTQTFLTDGTLSFYALPTWQIIIWGVLLIAFTAWFVWLWGWSELLRDSGPAPGKGQLRTFSLARTQMAIWFFLAVTSYIFLRVVTGGSKVVITQTVLTLIGIATGTALGAEVQAANKFAKLQREKADLQNISNRTSEQQQRYDELVLLTADRANLEKEQTTLQAVTTPSAAQTSRLQEINNILKESLPVRVSAGFFQDILTDDVGISFHRFQMFIWTIVLVVFFIGDVLNTLAMPEFGNTLLALMGISSGTYLGFMLPETQSTPTK